MDDATLDALLGDLESDRVERKAALSDPDDVRKAICAFANDLPGHGQPGVVFVGVRDDGSCAGLSVTDELLLKLAQMKDDGAIQPFPSMDVDRRALAGCDVAVATVRPAFAPPIRLKGVTWVRVGPRCARASPEDERRLSERRRAHDLPFDLQPVATASLEDLDLDLFRRDYLPQAVDPDVLAENRRDVTDQLRSLRMLTREGTPTTLGVLVLGRDPTRHLPNSYVQFLRIEGTALHDPVRDQKRIDGPLAQLARRMDEVLDAHNAVATDIASASVEIRKPEYPRVALQQLTRNAVLHRSYEGTHAPVRVYWFSDRVEIHSPGGPYGQVSAANFGEPGVADYRNVHLAEAMRVLGFVQRFGVGIAMAREALAQNGNPLPEFLVESTRVVVTMRRRP
jgi:ATP-dependent DNA helicase RecG